MNWRLLRIAMLGTVCGLILAPGTWAQERMHAGKSGGWVTAADGVQIYYWEGGDGPEGHRAQANGKPPSLLFVPGWTMPAWIWEKQIDHFSKTTRVVAMDPRSQGASTKTTEGLYPEARARDIKAVVEQLHLAPVVLVGWSMGVNEVASYINEFGNEGVAGIVLVDGGVSFEDPMIIGILKYAGSMMKDRPTKTEAFVRNMYRKPQSEEYLKRVTAASLETPTAQAMALFVGALATDNRPALAKFARPTLLVITKSPLDAAAFDMQKRIPGARLEQFEDAGHALFVDDADRFNAVLDEFIKGLK